MGVFDKLATRIKCMVGKALIDAVTDTDQIQLVKISGVENEVQSDIERIQDYGITSNPPRGSESIVLYLGGNRDHGVVVKTDSGEYRISNLESGEVCIYSQFGQKILLDSNGDIAINDGNDNAVRFSDVKSTLDALVESYTQHVHPGVTSGTASTAVITPAPVIPSIDNAKIDEIKFP